MDAYKSQALKVNSWIWLEGYFVYHINRQVCAIGDSLKEEDVNNYIVQSSFADWNMPKYLTYSEIEVETLGRSCDVRDVKGKLCFVGDVIKIFLSENSDEYVLARFSSTKRGISLEPLFDDSSDYHIFPNKSVNWILLNYKFEKIGNIHNSKIRKKRLEEFKKLEDGWDGVFAKEPSEETIETASQVSKQMNFYRNVTMYPTSIGSISFGYVEKNKFLEIIVLDSNIRLIFASGLKDNVEEETTIEDFKSKLNKMLRKYFNIEKEFLQ